MKKKKILIYVILGVLAALSLVALAYSALGIVSHTLTVRHDIAEPKLQNGCFSPIEFGVDITADSEYMGLNRYIMYTDSTGAVTHTITDENYEDYGEDIVFFSQYFEALREGKFADFDSFYTDAYFRTNEHTDTDFGFTCQRIYDIHISYATSYEQSGKTYTTYEVEYKINKNDATFRRDIASDESRKQYITLAHGKDGIKINRVAYSYNPSFDYSANAVKTQIYVGIAALAMLAVLALIFTVIKKKEKANGRNAS